MGNWLTTRRELIVHSMTGASGLALAFAFPWVFESKSARAEAAASTLQAYIKIYADNRIEVVVVKAEMGQGVITSLAMLLCEDLEAHWPDVSVKLEGEMPPYFDPQFGAGPVTAGSTSVRQQFQRLRTVGASVKEMLLQAAGQSFGLDPSGLYARESKIYDQAGTQRCTFGDVARAAINLPLPLQPYLKPASEFRLIGKATRNKDGPDKIEGRAVFGMDVSMPGLQYAAIRHHPSFGSSLNNFSELEATIKAPYRLFEIGQALAIVGPSYWQAQKLLNQVPAAYTLSDAMKASQQAVLEERLLTAAADFSGTAVLEKGDATAGLAASSERIEATYFVPFLAHSALEMMCCTAYVKADSCELWAPTQGAAGTQTQVAKALQLKPENVKVNATFLGGGFGRKTENDAAIQAALLSQKVGQPVKVIWSRQEDTQHDFYRPAFAARLEAGLQDAKLSTWMGKNAGSSILRRFAPNRGVDGTSIDGFTQLSYAIEHQRMWHQEVDLGIPVGFWRSVGKSQNCFFTESFFDEVAAKLGRDPLQLRMEYLRDKPRALAVLEKLAELTQYQAKAQRLGVAFMEGYGSLAAMAAQVVIEDKKVRVEKLSCVVDCGQLVNPQGAEAQIQGGAIFGLAATLFGKVTIKDHRVQQSIFADAPFLRLGNSPAMEVAFIQSQAASSGLGEVSTPLVAPAVCNAIFRQYGQRVRRLPLADFTFT